MILPTVPLTHEAVAAYLDAAIRHWRVRLDQGDPIAVYYVDAFQAVRDSLIGSTLPAPPDGGAA